MVQQTLQAPNDEIRCQSVRVALRIDSDFEQTRAATRRSLYGRCWEELSADNRRADWDQMTQELLRTAGTYLEQVRARQLLSTDARQ